MLDILKFVLSDFWIFIGFYLILNCILYYFINLIFKIYNRTLRHRNILKYGYPPAHCDADGDFKTKEK